MKKIVLNIECIGIIYCDICIHQNVFEGKLIGLIFNY
jgi:hypothetical protein